MNNLAYLLLGGNLGDRQLLLSEAVHELSQHAGKVMATSALYNTQAWPQHAHQKDYLNQAIALQTHLTAQDLLHQTQAIEKQLGRTRKQKWEARLIDIDILFYNEVILESKSLTLPHPRLHTRKFALTPLCEIARNYIHPILKKSIAELLKECTDPLRIELFTKP